MALLGQGLLAIWNGISDAPGAELEFVRWHIREHIPERVGLPGFLRGRRYVALKGHPKYFNFYETESVRTLESPAYLARLNDPTPWTKAVVKEFRDTSRTLCNVVLSRGAGEGAVILTIQVGGVADDAAFATAMTRTLIGEVQPMDGITAVHLVKGTEPQVKAATAEKALRGAPDRTCEWLLLVEAAGAEFLEAVEAGPLSAANLAKIAPGAGVTHGTYSLQYGLSQIELRTSD
jgi:hypothetical protein